MMARFNRKQFIAGISIQAAESANACGIIPANVPKEVAVVSDFTAGDATKK
ncbi:hypothetical protein HED55_04275 [Ochrobactrum haematophilum]|uniref:ABC transporter substrate-binding protein n=1 Tax=Brucella haematophila TaxID=419474 RepID=A0ABX1DIR8_9HYPH|nr:hypothetical protein [Brucella haematophila]